MGRSKRSKSMPKKVRKFVQRYRKRMSDLYEDQEPVSNIKKDDLFEAGYTYKLDVLTEEEREEWMHGGKFIDKNGIEVTTPSRDFDYFFKILDNDAEVKIFHVIGELYYEGARLTDKEQLPNVEKSARENHQWSDLISKVPDDKPTEYVMPDTLPKGYDTITLSGGPLNGQIRAYPKAAKSYVEVVGREVRSGKIVSITARYQQSTEDTTIYQFKHMI